ncbi:MAG TPA: glycosyltransferase family 39 protein [Flavipsychrobacter sp.]|nr:glycosyltransferase family 39 protein [Flavipsychrobacter sp.]
MNSLSKREIASLTALMCISFAIKIYLAINMPIQIDEAYTYSYFAKSGLLFSITDYTVPNNHILHTVLTILAIRLPFGPTLDIRLFPIIESTICIFLFYVVCRRLLNASVSILVTAIFSIVFAVEYYGYASRGYSLVLLFFIVCYYCVMRIVQGQNDKKYIVTISIASVLGLYTMPSFLYAYGTLGIFLLCLFIKRKNYNEIKRLIIFGLATLAVTFLLYTPIFVHAGFKAVFNNPFVRPAERKIVLQRLLPGFSNIYELLFGVPYVYVAVALIIIVSLFDKNNKGIAYLNIFIALFALIIPIMHSVIAYPRSWIYIIVPIMISLGIALNGVYSRVPFYVSLIVTTVIFAGLNIFYFERVRRFDDTFFKARDAAYKLISYKPRYVYFNTWLDGNIRYYAALEKQNFDATCTYGDFRYDLKVIGKKPFDYYVMYSDEIVKPEDSLKVVYANDVISIYKKR